VKQSAKKVVHSFLVDVSNTAAFDFIIVHAENCWL